MSTEDSIRTLDDVNTRQANWYVSDRGQTFGPYAEAQIRWGLQEGRISGNMSIRQNDSRWISCETVRNAFEKLEKEGYFIRTAGQIAGPFTKQKLLSMVNQGELLTTALIRHGNNGSWNSVEDQLRESKSVLTPNATNPSRPIDQLRTSIPSYALVVTQAAAVTEALPELEEHPYADFPEAEILFESDQLQNELTEDPLGTSNTPSMPPISAKLIRQPSFASFDELETLWRKFLSLIAADKRFFQEVVSPILKSGLLMLLVSILCDTLTANIPISAALGLCGFVYAVVFRYRLHKHSFFKRLSAMYRSRWQDLKHSASCVPRRTIKRLLLTVARKL